MSGKDSARGGVWHPHTVFLLRELDEDGSGGRFEDSYAKTDTPVKYFMTTAYPPSLQMGKINRIHFKLNVTNAVTYTLRLYSAAEADNEKSNMKMLWESPAARGDDVEYDETELDIPFVLAAPHKMYFCLEWSAAPGTTKGFIDVSGEVVK